MSEKTKIDWCDSTHNFWQGCTKVSAGCKNCYAEARDKRFSGGKHWGVGSPRARSASFYKPLKWNQKPWICDECGADHPLGIEVCGAEQFAGGKPIGFCTNGNFHRRRVFSLSLGDWLDPEVPIEWLADLLRVIHQCQNLDWILCTKRPELFHQRMSAVWSPRDFNDPAKGMAMAWSNGQPAGTNDDGTPMFDVPKNVTVLASVENQDAADNRYGELLHIPGVRRGFSVEPLLEDINLHLQHGCSGCNHPGNILIHWNEHGRCSTCDGTGQEPSGIDWVIIGGESGKNARPCNVEWIRSIKEQCAVAKVACFVKQLGATTVGGDDIPIGTIKDPKGGDWNEWPDDLRVREFPNFRHLPT